jgi:hypothetical protein
MQVACMSNAERIRNEGAFIYFRVEWKVSLDAPQ